MPKGPGKYDALCTAAQEASDADAVIMLIVNGHLGSGFSVQATSPELIRRIPAILRDLADTIESDVNA